MRPPFPSLFRLAIVCLLAVFGAAACVAPQSIREKKILLIGGPPSHGAGQHEHNAGVLLLQKCLRSVPGLKTEVVLNGWPQDPRAFDGVDAVVIFADGGPRHIALQGDHLAQLERALSKGAGLGLLHYAVEPTVPKGQAEFLKWVGGAFEINWSVNPHWHAQFKSLPSHPIARGVKPFSILDEWYFNLRFVDRLKGITPLLVAVPDASTTTRKDGPHEGNPAVRAMVARGDPQTVSWAYQRSDGGRGFGFTGAHFHSNWGNENFRKLVLNAVLWLAKMDVPANGVSSILTADDLTTNLDPIDPNTKRKTMPPSPATQGD